MVFNHPELERIRRDRLTGLAKPMRSVDNVLPLSLKNDLNDPRTDEMKPKAKGSDSQEKKIKPKAKGSDSKEKKMKSKAKGSDSQEKEMKETKKNGWKEKALLWTSVALNIITIPLLAALVIYEVLDD